MYLEDLKTNANKTLLYYTRYFDFKPHVKYFQDLKTYANKIYIHTHISLILTFLITNSIIY